MSLCLKKIRRKLADFLSQFGKEQGKLKLVFQFMELIVEQYNLNPQFVCDFLFNSNSSIQIDKDENNQRLRISNKEKNKTRTSSFDIKNERLNDTKYESSHTNHKNEESERNDQNHATSPENTRVLVMRRGRKRKNPEQYKEVEIRRPRSRIRSSSVPNYLYSNKRDHSSSGSLVGKSYFLKENRRLDSFRDLFDDDDDDDRISTTTNNNYNNSILKDNQGEHDDFYEKDTSFEYGSFFQYDSFDSNISQHDFAINQSANDYDNGQVNEHENENENQNLMANDHMTNSNFSLYNSPCPSPVFTDSGDIVETSSIRSYKTEYCRVCQCALGAHLNHNFNGVRVCGGCREFFKRSRTDCDKYECTGGDDNCNILVANRTKCRKCRLKKCLQVGMKHSDMRMERSLSVRRGNLVCTVCEDDGAMIHYGIPACLRCFKFFSTHKRDPNKLKCGKDGNCKITKGLNNKCSRCRFDKFAKKIKCLKANGGKI